ncbi:unnamed protein product [Microthlaspi erraticum]|uniref:MATH domain-containing protein n=1 Tax=Microthlaspi erraticum TaxID=1685480 RepID=A0A6D2KX07_9BRAS|nr:unnamed protein product [Microthlaspi erraticum]
MLKTEESCAGANSTMMNKFGDRLPSTYSMKIQSLSQLKSLFPCTDDTNPVHSLPENTNDVEGKQFNAVRPVWGSPQVLPLDTFNDPNNGYVFDGDECEFGVDVMVPLTNWEVTLSPFLRNPLILNYLGRVLKLYPKGYSTTYCQWLSLFLHLPDSGTMKAGEEIYGGVDFRILDPFGCNHFSKNLSQRWDKDSSAWGWNEFVSLDRLQKGYLDKEGSLKVEVEFVVVSTTKYSS